MTFEPSRRSFLAAAAALPAAANAAGTDSISYRILGKTGLKVTTVGFGAMITSDPSVITRALDMGITYFDTARGYQNGNCERMVGAALKGTRRVGEEGVHTKVWEGRSMKNPKNLSSTLHQLPPLFAAYSPKTT